MSRTVKAQHPAVRDDIADLVTRRPLPGANLPHLDPFLFLNHHGPQVYPPGNQGLPFGPHPHRGFETVSFIISGEMAHLDSAGFESVIRTGGVQWMTAGRGLIHAEVSPEDFKRDGGPLEILQLWLNLPARLKMTEPAYVGEQADAMPVVELADGGFMQLISGEHKGRTGPIVSRTGVCMATVTMATNSGIALPAPRGRQVFFYLVRGELVSHGETLKPHHLIEWNDDGDVIALEARSESLVAFGHADPIGEPIVSYGPFVMNTREEIEQAIRDYQAGLFGREPQIASR